MNELSLFSGLCSMTLGLRLGGLDIRTVGYCDNEPYIQEVIKARIRDGLLDDAPIIGDLRSFDFTVYRGLVDILTGGFPCQPHSTAGQRRGVDDERNLWPDTLRVIREVGPRWVLLENVPGILAGGDRDPYGGTVVGQLSEIGYDCQWGVVSAADVGAPHRRERWWCLAHANGVGPASFTRNTGEECSLSETQRKPKHDSVVLGRGCSTLAHARRRGRHGLQPDGFPGCGEKTAPSRQGADVADPDTSGLTESPGSRAAQRGYQGLPAWPPGPGDRDGWAGVLGEWPEFAPAVANTQRGNDIRRQSEPGPGQDKRAVIQGPSQGDDGQRSSQSLVRRVANGTPHRVERLRALGNGIVPASVALFLRRISAVG